MLIENNDLNARSIIFLLLIKKNDSAPLKMRHKVRFVPAGVGFLFKFSFIICTRRCQLPVALSVYVPSPIVGRPHQQRVHQKSQ